MQGMNNSTWVLATQRSGRSNPQPATTGISYSNHAERCAATRS
jgi:hypothetical protein